MKVTREEILEALSNVIEPDLKKDIVALNLISDFKIEGDHVSFKVSIKNAAMHAKRRMIEACEFAIQRKFKDQLSIQVEIVGMKKEESSQKVLPNIQNIIAVLIVIFFQKNFCYLHACHTDAIFLWFISICIE